MHAKELYQCLQQQLHRILSTIQTIKHQICTRILGETHTIYEKANISTEVGRLNQEPSSAK